MYYNQDGGEDDWVNPETAAVQQGPRAMTTGDFERFTAGLTAGVARFESRLKCSSPLRQAGIELSPGLELRCLEMWTMDYNIIPDRENALYAKAYEVFLAVVQASRDQASVTRFGVKHGFPSARQYAADHHRDWQKYTAKHGDHPLYGVFLKDYAEWL